MNIRKLTVFVFILILFVNTFSLAHGTESAKYQKEADKLNVLSIFQGTDKGFELDRPPTRIEAGIIFVRLMGGEKEALDKKYSHPFTDVPKWGTDYVGFLYHHKLIKGITDTKFGSRKIINAPAYTTIALRAIGYKEESGDFKWRKSLDKALEIGLIDQPFCDDLLSCKFLRDHVVKISYDVLNQPVKGGTATLAEKLIAYGTLTKELVDMIMLEDPELPEIIEPITGPGIEPTTDPAIRPTTDPAINPASSPAIVI